MTTPFRAEDGQTMAEYAVMLGVITLAMVLALQVFATAVFDDISGIAEIVDSVTP
jgi:Flp pilus assembly pilin Flp